MKNHPFFLPTLFAALLALPAAGPAQTNATSGAAAPAGDAQADLQQQYMAAAKKAQAEPDIKAALESARSAQKLAREQLKMKMKELDLSMAALIDNKDKKAVSPADKDKLARLRIQAMADENVKAASERSHKALAEAGVKLNARIKEIDPSLVPYIEEMQKMKAGRKMSGKKAATPPAP